MIIDGDMESFPTGELRATATAAVATNGNLLVAGHSLDIEMQQIPGTRMFIAHHRWSRMEIAPAIQMSPAQNTADGGGTEPRALRDLITRTMLPSQFDHPH